MLNIPEKKTSESKGMIRAGSLRRGQGMVEFIIAVPALMVVLLGIYQVTIVAIKLQRMQIVAHYAARTYSMQTIRGVSAGSEATLRDRRNRIAQSVEERVREYLGSRTNVEITGERVDVSLPVKIEIWGLKREFTLSTHVCMEDEPLIYGGGRWE